MNTAPVNTPLIAEPVLDQARQKLAREYSRLRRRLSLGESGLSLVLLLILVFTGVSRWFTGLFHLPVVALAVIFFLILVIAYELLTSPLSYYSGFVLPHRYGIATQKLRGWLADLGKGGALSLVFGAAAVACLLVVVEFPHHLVAASLGSDSGSFYSHVYRRSYISGPAFLQGQTTGRYRLEVQIGTTGREGRSQDKWDFCSGF